MSEKRRVYDRPIAGQRFGRWELIEPAVARGTSNTKHRYWLCRCDCGTVREVSETNLSRGVTTGCGCGHRGKGGYNRTHGGTGTPEHTAWLFMRRRCRAQDRTYYHGRGITVCGRWQSFENFLDDMGLKPGPHYTLERLNNDGNYEPGNVIWATPLQQGNNKRNNRLLSYDGRTMTMSQWSRELGFPRHLIRLRLKYGWSIERALCTPYTPRARHTHE